MCRASCIWPEWSDLPKGPAGLPIVHGIPMAEEEYRVSGWHSRGEYQSGRGVTEQLWIAPLDRLIEWGRRERRARDERIAAAQARREADDEYSAQVAASIDERYR